jgi:DNA-binding NarL/FixJ family response regulator
MIRVMLVDDHELFREGLRSLLARDPTLSVVATAGDAREAKLMLASRPVDLLIVDVNLPGSGGVPLVRDLKHEDRFRPVLMLSMHEHLDIVADALDSGADGYALKRQSPKELLHAIQTVAGGGRYLAPEIRASLDGDKPIAPTPFMRLLSRREREIFELLVRGDSNCKIAHQLFISVKTVETHRTRIMKKREVHNMADLVRLAVRHGHLTAEQTATQTQQQQRADQQRNPQEIPKAQP